MWFSATVAGGDPLRLTDIRLAINARSHAMR
jgi:hypothetical protein